MEFVSVREFNASPKKTREKLARDGKLILMNNNQPMALVINLTSENFEDTLEAARQIESLGLFKSMRTEAESRGFLSDDEIMAEIETSRREEPGNQGSGE